MMNVQRSLWQGDAAWRVSALDATVHWVCHNDVHRAAPSRGGCGGLTVHRGRWAYCDGMVDDDQHEWAPTGGVPIDRLVDWTKAMDQLRATTVRR